MSITTESLLGLLHLASPALPVGAFAYSQGLETAIDRQWCYNRETTGNWISELMQQGMARLDIPVFFRLYDAFAVEDRQQVNHWNETLLAFRETRELYDEDCQVGRAFAVWVNPCIRTKPVRTGCNRRHRQPCSPCPRYVMALIRKPLRQGCSGPGVRTR